MSEPVPVVCPCCGAKLSVDASTGDIVAAEPPRGTPKSFEDALGDIRSGGTRREQAFSKAFDQTRRLDEVLDKKFEEAKKKAAKDPGKARNPFDDE